MISKSGLIEKNYEIKTPKNHIKTFLNIVYDSFARMKLSFSNQTEAYDNYL